jgi:hypothetical protein
VANLLELSCACGWTAQVAEGRLFAGVVKLFVCRDCRAVVDVLTWVSGHRGETQGPIAQRCPRCHGTKLVNWRRGNTRSGPCPRCGTEMKLRCVGIAD